MKRTTLFALGLFTLSSSLVAGEIEFEIDPGRTSIAFVLGATMHSVHGKAAATTGFLTLDSDSGLVTGEVTVDATSAETGNKKRDKKMHAKVLRTAEHPLIVLHARLLEGELSPEGSSDVILVGDMQILGQFHEISFPLQIEIARGRFAATSTFEVPYVEWGLDDPSTFVLRVAKVVEVTVKAEGKVRIAGTSR